MAAFCHFYRYTPSEFRALTVKDFRELADYMNDYIAAMTKKK